MSNETFTFEDRCRIAAECLPKAGYRTMLEALHREMLAEMAKVVRFTSDEQGAAKLPDPHWRWETDPADAYTADQMRAYAAEQVAAERERWIGGVRVQTPTDAIEQEIQAHARRAVAAERERCAKVCESLNMRPAKRPLSALDCARAIRSNV